MTEKEIILQIQKLKQIKPRAEFKKFSRDILISQIKAYAPADRAELKPEINWFFYLRAFTETFVQRTLQPAVVLLSMLFLVLGSSLAVNAAFYSLPGDPLYPVKISLEKTQMALIRDQADKAELKIEFAKKRVAELDKVVAQAEEPAKQAKKVNLLVKKFKNEVEGVKDQLQSPDQEKSVIFKIAISVDSATAALAQSLNESAAKLPAESQAAVASAAASAEETGLSALQSFVSAATSTEAELAKDDISSSLTQKIVNLKQKITGLASSLAENDLAEINKLIAETETLMIAAEFDKVLANITTIKDLLKKAIPEDVSVNSEEKVEILQNNTVEASGIADVSVTEQNGASPVENEKSADDSGQTETTVEIIEKQP